jgi:hypothetical protein
MAAGGVLFGAVALGQQSAVAGIDGGVGFEVPLDQRLQPLKDQATHFLVGRWEWEFPDLKCSETMELTKDGSLTGQSKEERIEADVTLSTLVDDKRFIIVQLKSVSSNRKADCLGLVKTYETKNVIVFYVADGEKGLRACTGLDIRLCKVVVKRVP